MHHTFNSLRSSLINALEVIGGAVFVMALCLIISLGMALNGAENAPTEKVTSSTSASAEATTINTKSTTVAPLTPTLDLRDALAISVRERNALSEEVAQLQTQKWFILGCVMVMTGVSIWLGMMILNRGLHPAPPVENKSGKKERESDIFPADTQTGSITSVTSRKNATITIRNGATQKEEISEKMETRRFFNKDEDSNSKRIARGATATVVRKTSKIEAPPVDQEPSLRPISDRTEKKVTPVETPQAVTATQSRPKTVRVDHQSDRLAPVEGAVKPGTGPIYRQSGFSILEVMISLAILATVLASVISSVYTLHYSRNMAKERTTANEIARMVIERIMAAPAGSLASGTSFLAARFESFETISGKNKPLTQQDIRSELQSFSGITNLNTHLLSSSNPDGINAALGLNGLKIFVEYYRIENLVYALQNDRALDLNDNGMDDKYFDTTANLIIPKYYDANPIFLDKNLDDRLEGDAGTMAIRVVVKWTGIQGFEEKSEHIFAKGL